MANPYEIAGRRKKAERLAAAAKSLGGDARSVERLTPEEWCNLARVAEVKVPSGETIKVVIEILREMEEF